MRCVAVPGIDSLQQYGPVIAVGCMRRPCLASNGFPVRAFGDDADDRLTRTASTTSLTISSCVRVVAMTEATGSCLLLEVLIVSLYEGRRAKATVKQKFFARTSMRAARTKVVAKHHFSLIPGQPLPRKKSARRRRSRSKPRCPDRRVTARPDLRCPRFCENFGAAESKTAGSYDY
jgi:hypothetical protein